ncbi:endonuclease [Vibrio phage K460]
MARCKRTEHFSEDFVENFKCDYKPLTSRFQDLTGKVFGKLTVMKLYKKEKPHTTWFVKCECGSITTKKTNQLNRGVIQCTECAFNNHGDSKCKGEDFYLEQVQNKHPSYQLKDSYDAKGRTNWLWYCPDCNTPFHATPSNLISSRDKVCPCNTLRFAKWNKKLRERQVLDICKQRGLKFLGWEDDYVGVTSRVFVKCEKHQHYPIRIGNLVTRGAEYGCPYCYEDRKGNHLRHGLTKFIEDATEAHNGQFDYSEYNYKCSRTPSKITCKVCQGSFKASYDNHVNKKRGCPSCKGKNQEHAYIILVQDGETPVSLKYGIARQTKKRADEHKNACVFETKLLSDWKFPDSISCKAAELEVKRNVEGSVLSTTEFPSGNTETTHVYNLEYIESVYIKHGGVKVYE